MYISIIIYILVSMDLDFEFIGDCAWGAIEAKDYNGKPLGIIHFNTSTHNNMMILMNLKVKQKHRRKGVANALARETCKLIRTQCKQYKRLWGDVRRAEALLAINRTFGEPIEIYDSNQGKNITIKEALRLLPGRNRHYRKYKGIYVEWRTEKCNY